MSAIFISYRRSDSNDVTGRIHDHLELYFGKDAIFRDIDSITLGDFPNQLDRALNESSVMLAVIGPTWIDTADKNGRRLDEPGDFVRQEIAAALKRKIPVIPVLISGAHMPKREELPAILKTLARQQAFEIRTARDFRRDVGELCRRISQLAGLVGFDYFNLLADCRNLGLVRAFANFAEDSSVLDAIARARSLTVVMNDGRSWVDSNQELIRRRIRNPDQETNIVLLHPKSSFLSILIRKNRKSAARQVEEIHHSFRIIMDSLVPGSRAQLRGHFGFSPSTLIATEEVAFSSPYYFMESGALPMFKYEARKSGGLFDKIRGDAQSLFDASEPLCEDSFK